eukprot:1150371-Pelagomonas_calceolata.AAC.2
MEQPSPYPLLSAYGMEGLGADAEGVCQQASHPKTPYACVSNGHWVPQPCPQQPLLRPSRSALSKVSAAAVLSHGPAVEVWCNTRLCSQVGLHLKFGVTHGRAFTWACSCSPVQHRIPGIPFCLLHACCRK